MKKRFAALIALMMTVALAQNVATVRQRTTDLPRNDADQFVLNTYFGAISAVQDSCPDGLTASLKQQNALAACATFRSGADRADLLRSAVEAQFLSATMGSDAAWVAPLTANTDFGTVRQLKYKGTTYYLTLDANNGEARVIVFE